MGTLPNRISAVCNDDGSEGADIINVLPLLKYSCTLNLTCNLPSCITFRIFIVTRNYLAGSGACYWYD